MAAVSYDPLPATARRWRRRSGIGWLLAVLASWPASSQWQPTRHFGVREGLAQSQVTDLAEDAFGYLWIATQGGLSRWDGRELVLVTAENGLPDDLLTALATDAVGGLWVGADSGALAYRAEEEIRVEDGPDAAPILGLAEAGGHLLVATPGGVWDRRGPGRFVSLASGALLAFDGDGGAAAWVTVEEWFYRDAAGDLFSGRLPAGIEVPTAVAIDGAALWIADERGNCLRSSPPGAFTAPLQVTGVTGVRALLPDGEGGLWIGGERDLALLRADGEIRRRPIHPEPRRLEIRALHRDREGGIFVGTFTEGLHHLSPGAFLILDRRSGLDTTTVWSFVEDEAAGCLWMATEETGVVRWCDGRVTTHLRPGRELPEGRVISLARSPDGSLWIGAAGGVGVRRPDGSLRLWTEEDGLPDAYVRVVAVDPEARVWAATRSGLARLDGERWTAWGLAEGLPDLSLRGLAFDPEGVVWIATHAAGLVRFDGTGFRSLDRRHGLPHDRVWCLLLDSRDHLWVGTDAGIWSRARSGGPAMVLGSADGLPSLNVLFLVEDEVGDIWAGTTRGVARISPAGEVRLVLGPGDGLSDAEAAENAALRARDGRLWLGSADGVTVIDPSRMQPNPHPPRLVLEEILAAGERRGGPFPRRPESSGAPLSLTLGPGVDDLRFRFTGISFSRPEQVRYRFFLAGWEEPPAELSADRTAVYRKVPPGRYRFHLEAENEAGVVTPVPLLVDLVLRPPWYRSVLFRVASLALAILVAGIVLFSYVVRQDRLRRRLEGLVSERTAELSDANRRIRQQNLQLQELSRTDPLTGLANRRVLAERLPAEIALLRRERQRIATDAQQAIGAAILLLDLDHFKAVNDEHGHATGDRVLVAISRAVESTVREGDLVVRWGGEEIAVLVRGVDPQGLRHLVRRILCAVAEVTVRGERGASLRVTVSAGFLPVPLGQHDLAAAEDWPRLLDLADRLLYRAKELGRDRAVGLLPVAASISETAAVKSWIDCGQAAGLVAVEVIRGEVIRGEVVGK